MFDEILALGDIELTARVLDILKFRRFGKRVPKAILQKVCELSDHKEGSIRRRVVLAVGHAPIETKQTILEKALCDSEEAVRKTARTSTLALPLVPAQRLLLQALHNPKEQIRANAVCGLVLAGKVSIEPLVAALRASNNDVRRAAADALGQLNWQPESDVERGQYLVALRDWPACVRLGRSAVEPLVAALRDESRDVRRAAADALGQLNWQPESDVERGQYLVALQDWPACVRLGRSAVESLAVALRDDNTGVQRAAVNALGQIGDARAVEPLA